MNAGFAITDNKGFHVTFENDWTVSVQFGGGNYSSNYNLPIGSARTEPLPPSTTAEIAAWDAAGNWHQWVRESCEEGETYTVEVEGYQTPADVLAFMNLIAAKPTSAAAADA